MILKIKNPAHEGDEATMHQIFVEKAVCSLLKHKIAGLDRGMIIPDDLIAEAESFMDRNAIVEANYECCPQCLKAHVLKHARERGLTKREQAYLDDVLYGDEGHEGYYLDENKLVRID